MTSESSSAVGLKPAPRLKQVGDEHSERVQDRKHRSKRDAMILPHNANPDRIEFSERTTYRWFCALSIKDKIPDHSAFSHARNERFRDSDIFRQVFERVGWAGRR